MGDAPVMIDGLRSPDDLLQRLEGPSAELARKLHPKTPAAPAAPASAPAPEAEKVDEGPVMRFRAHAKSFRITLNFRTKSDDGKRMIDNPFIVTFQDGLLDLTKRELPIPAEDVSKLLTNARGYGLGRDFWSFDEEKRRADESEQESLIARVKSDPTLRAKLRAELADDFDATPQS